MKSILKKAIVMLVAVAVLVVPLMANAATYNDDYIKLSVGTKNYNVNTANDYAIFELSPTAEGEYTVSAAGKKVGIVSYITMWVTFEPSDSVVCEDSVTLECKSVGQGILVAVKADKSPISITVTKKELEKEEEIPWTVYKNVHTPTTFKFEGDAEALQYVDTFDGVDDSPFRDEDGFYHFGSEDGPLLYVDLDDTMMNLIDAVGYGKLAYVGYDGEKIVTKINFTDAFNEYASKADGNTMLYPLTEDLIQIYKLVGQNNKWYGEDGWIGGDDFDAWMFACYYDASLIEEGDGEGDDDIIDDGNNEGNKDTETEDKDDNKNEEDGKTEDNKTEDNKTEDNKTEDKKDPYATSPSTGNSVAGFAALALVSATAVLVIRKKAEL